VSNPGDRWRKSWIIGALGAALLGAVILGRCASTNSSSSATSFTAASVRPDSARFAAELPAGAEVLVLRGTVTSKTATALRLRAKDLATETPGLQIDDQLEISAQGIDLAEPEGLLVALSQGLARPAALRINTEFGTELTGVARSEEDRSIAAKIVAASLGEGAIVKNSVTLLPAEDQTPADTEETEAAASIDTETVPADTATAETLAVVEPEPATTLPVTTLPVTTLPVTTLPVTTLPEATVAPTTVPEPTTTVAPTLEANGTIALEGVQFDLGSARLTRDSATVLDRLVKTLNDNPDLKIAITGHTDSSGDPGFNKTLSKARANSVLAYLTKAGIDATRLKAEGLGDSKPRADNATSAGRKQNRRIEVTAQ
jgi:outer membrane protein OmpA-like peptidoglycan-associated protein